VAAKPIFSANRAAARRLVAAPVTATYLAIQILCKGRDSRLPPSEVVMNDITVAAPVDLTANAVRHIAEILRTEPAGSALRIAVEGGGCSGFQYKYAIVPDTTDGDIIIAAGDAKVAIDPISLDYLRGSKVDFVDDLMGRAFKIDNPAATASCGCGTSFSLD
jgi:iron-sulfur cluster assembly accessory protein